MALTQEQELAFTRISDQLLDLSEDIDAVLNATTATVSSLRDEITNLETVRDTLQANDQADADTIAQLNATIDALNAAEEAEDQEVVERLSAISDSLSGLDTTIETALGNDEE